jgi:integral membrane protein (TIGR01906 family)
LILVLTSPVLFLGIPLKLAFTEAFVRWEYSKKDFPEDPYGLDNRTRLELAIKGLRAVLSDEGFREFKRAKLLDGTNAFNEREIKHIADVKRVLGIFFKAVWMTAALWILFMLTVRDRAIMGKALLYSSAFSFFIIFGSLLFSLINYNKAFEVFHNFVFDPYSWRFRYEDTLLRIYPMKFWQDGTLFVLGAALILIALTFALGIFLLRYKRSS